MVTVVVREHPAAGLGVAPPVTVATSAGTLPQPGLLLPGWEERPGRSSAGRQGCARHDFRCAYDDGTEPGRCPRCHSTWEAIGAPRNPARLGGGDRAAHEAWHDQADARRAAARDRARARTARTRESGPVPAPGP